MKKDDLNVIMLFMLLLFPSFFSIAYLTINLNSAQNENINSEHNTMPVTSDIYCELITAGYCHGGMNK